ncbi:MAG: hypothetical protein ACLVKO_06865 [Dysgonomonas sp.]
MRILLLVCVIIYCGIINASADPYYMDPPSKQMEMKLNELPSQQTLKNIQADSDEDEDGPPGSGSGGGGAVGTVPVGDGIIPMLLGGITYFSFVFYRKKTKKQKNKS